MNFNDGDYCIFKTRTGWVVATIIGRTKNLLDQKWVVAVPGRARHVYVPFRDAHKKLEYRHREIERFGRRIFF